MWKMMMLAQLRDEKVGVISWIEIKGGLINLGKKHPRWQIWTLTQVLITSVYWFIGHKFTSYRDNTRRGLFGLLQFNSVCQTTWSTSYTHCCTVGCTILTSSAHYASHRPSSTHHRLEIQVRTRFNSHNLSNCHSVARYVIPT